MTQIALTDESQVEAFENATAAVETDVDDSDVPIEGERWNGDVKAGEVVRILAEAYTGDTPIVEA